MNNAHRKTLQALFALPTARNVAYRQLESLLLALGCDKVEGEGSRVAFHKDGVTLAMHRPHPGKELKPYQVRFARGFLESLGIGP